MICPVDGNELLITHREGIEIDYCPKCRGVWLDRGELDKLIERETQRGAGQRPPAISYDNNSTGYKRKNDEDDYETRRSPQGKRRNSFLEDIFDIFD